MSMSSNDSEEPKPLVEDSPHEEVRAAVSNVDDPEMACVCPGQNISHLRRQSGCG